MVSRHYILRGRVQGVGFRYFVLQAARELQLRGWVRNVRTGEVEVHAEGKESAVLEFEGRLRRGPAWARVESMEVEEVKAGGYSHFVIER